mmetsp:Transcript_46351/g.110142  ORF Transcript_46351/g.110142 Transcript_46351/m.110142 type:complete len:589 (+) Transcript_46351:171-1937(+)
MAPVSRPMRAARAPRLCSGPGRAWVASALLMFPPLVASSTTALLRAPPLCYAFAPPLTRVEPRAQLSASFPSAPRTRVGAPSCSLLGPARFAGPAAGGPQLGLGSRARSDWRPVKKSVDLKSQAIGGAEGEAAPHGEIWADKSVSFADLGLQEDLTTALSALGFSRPTQIQASAIPKILSGRDVIMGAETGSGKTLSYLLPIIERVLGERTTWDGRPEAIILVPNQELALQVVSVLQSFGDSSMALKVPVSLLAGSSPAERGETVITVATPSAVLRFTDPWFLEQVHTAVIDEADMLLDGGFVSDVQKILDFLAPAMSNTRKREIIRNGAARIEAGETKEALILEAELAEVRQPSQVIFAAATLPDWKGDKVKSVVRSLVKRFPDIERITSSALHTHSPRALHRWVDVSSEPMPALLDALDEHPDVRTMVFVNTVAAAKEVGEELRALLEEDAAEKGEDVVPRPMYMIHKEVPTLERSEALSLFKRNPNAILVCTDMAARGLDVQNVGHVIQYQFAANAVTHLHRAGRTARAGLEGVVTNFVDDVSREVARAIQEDSVEGGSIAPVFSRNRGFRRRLIRNGTGRAELD